MELKPFGTKIEQTSKVIHDKWFKGNQGDEVVFTERISVRKSYKKVVAVFFGSLVVIGVCGFGLDSSALEEESKIICSVLIGLVMGYWIS